VLLFGLSIQFADRWSDVVGVGGVEVLRWVSEQGDAGHRFFGRRFGRGFGRWLGVADRCGVEVGEVTRDRCLRRPVKDKVSAKTYRSTRNMDLDELIVSLNRTLAGWANYFRYGTSKAVFGTIDHHAWGRLMRWIRRKYSGKTRLGMPQFRSRFCDQGWRIAHNGVAFTGASSVSVIRYRYRGSTIATPWTPTPAAITKSLTNG